MKAIVIISHMALAQVLVLGTLIGLAGLEQGGGYASVFLATASPFVLGTQLMYIFTTDKE
jgi:hypothetical protein